MKKYKIKSKSQIPVPKTVGAISYKYGPSSLDSDYPICTQKACGAKATCAKTEHGRTYPNSLCVQHWLVMDIVRSGQDVGDSLLTSPGLLKARSKKQRVKKGSITNAVVDLIEKKGKKPPTYEEMRDVVLAVKVDSKFNKNHYRWYLNMWAKGKLVRKE